MELPDRHISFYQRIPKSNGSIITACYHQWAQFVRICKLCRTLTTRPDQNDLMAQDTACNQLSVPLTRKRAWAAVVLLLHNYAVCIRATATFGISSFSPTVLDSFTANKPVKNGWNRHGLARVSLSGGPQTSGTTCRNVSGHFLSKVSKFLLPKNRVGYITTIFMEWLINLTIDLKETGEISPSYSSLDLDAPPTSADQPLTSPSVWNTWVTVLRSISSQPSGNPHIGLVDMVVDALLCCGLYKQLSTK